MARDAKPKSFNITKPLRPYVGLWLKKLKRRGKPEGDSSSAYYRSLIEKDLEKRGPFTIPVMKWVEEPTDGGHNKANKDITAISLTPELEQEMEGRWRELRFDSWSDYLRRLIEKDLSENRIL